MTALTGCSGDDDDGESAQPISDDDRPTEAPALIVSGEMDSITTPHEGKLVASEFPNGEYFEVRSAGHVNALYYRNGKAATKMRSFLERHLGG